MSEQLNPLSTRPEGGYWKSFYAATKEIIDAAMGPVYRTNLKFRFKTAYNDSIGKLNDANKKLMEERMKFKDADVNCLLNARLAVKKALEVQKLLKEEYLDMFDTPLKIDED